MNLKDTTCPACLGEGELFDEDRQRWETCKACEGVGFRPYDDSWEEYGVYYVDTEFDTLPLPPVVDKRNPILRIVSAVVLFALRFFRIDPKDRIPF
ncbi:MAG: hypothetical protein IPK17_00300 [Chloroflexi bacterium]|uniref:hypothetical protein n=1 Tax=Candidatus Flexifilum breve TaxID=3140694 RepID=UPI0031347B3E|nr:hypothetical protein [Chloroflexota bacterium]